MDGVQCLRDPLSITPLKCRALRALERGTPTVRRRSDGVPFSGHASSARGVFSSARGGISSQASGCAHASTSGATGSHDNNAGINASATDSHDCSGFNSSSASDTVVRSSVDDSSSIARGPAIRVVPTLVPGARDRHHGPGCPTRGETAWSIARRLERRSHGGRSEAAWLVACI